MSATQLQLRRGNTAQNDSFIGAVGEITIDTEAKSIRIHDGTTVGGRSIPTYSGDVPVGGDYVVASYRAADGSSWYRQYISGWVEQGGRVTGAPYNSGTTVTLPVTMSDTYYSVLVSAKTNVHYTDSAMYNITSVSTIKVYTGFNGSSTQSTEVMWQVKGMAAA